MPKNECFLIVQNVSGVGQHISLINALNDPIFSSIKDGTYGEKMQLLCEIIRNQIINPAVQ